MQNVPPAKSTPPPRCSAGVHSRTMVAPTRFELVLTDCHRWLSQAGASESTGTQTYDLRIKRRIASRTGLAKSPQAEAISATSRGRRGQNSDTHVAHFARPEVSVTCPELAPFCPSGPSARLSEAPCAVPTCDAPVCPLPCTCPRLSDPAPPRVNPARGTSPRTGREGRAGDRRK